MSIQFPNLGINLDYVGKSIRIFGFEITVFGLLIAAGMLLGLGFIVLEARRCGEKEDDYLEMMILSLVTGVIGARALYVCFSWNLYKGNVNQIFNLRGGGLAFYGGLFGGMLGAAIYCAIRKKAFMQMADTACMGQGMEMMVASGVGRSFVVISRNIEESLICLMYRYPEEMRQRNHRGEWLFLI